jgi:hypothetical protein
MSAWQRSALRSFIASSPEEAFRHPNLASLRTPATIAWIVRSSSTIRTRGSSMGASQDFTRATLNLRISWPATKNLVYPNLASQERLSGMVQCARCYGASTGRLLGSGILAAGNGMSATVEAWVFGAFLRIASAAASKSATTFSSALGGRTLWFRPTCC